MNFNTVLMTNTRSSIYRTQL